MGIGVSENIEFLTPLTLVKWAERFSICYARLLCEQGQLFLKITKQLQTLLTINVVPTTGLEPV